MFTWKQLFKNTGQKQPEESKVGMALRTVVMREGIEAYSNAEHLAEKLSEQGISEIEIKQVQLVLAAGSFLRYKEQFSEGITATDINNIIQTTAVSGLAAETVRKVVSDLLFGVGISQNIHMEVSFDGGHSFINKDIYSIPSACGGELDDIETVLDTKKEEENSLSKEQFDFLNYCAAAGIPRAARILGKMYLEGTGAVKDIGKAGEYLGYAVRAGDTKAMVLLGDYCYENGYYNEAYELFTGPGTFAVDSSKRQTVSNLCSIKEFNRKEMAVWVGITVLIEVLILFLPASAVTGNHTVAKVICSMLNAGVFGLLLWNWYKHPYSDMRQYGLLYAFVAFIFMLVYIV